MGLSQDVVEPFNEQIVGFTGERVDIEGTLTLILSLAKVMNIVKQPRLDTFCWMRKHPTTSFWEGHPSTS